MQTVNNSTMTRIGRLLLYVIVLVFFMACFSSKASAQKAVKMPDSLVVSIKDTTGAVMAYVEKGKDSLVIVNAEKTARLLFNDYKRVVAQSQIMYFELDILRRIVSFIGVSGNITDGNGFRKSLQQYIEYQNRTQK